MFTRHISRQLAAHLDRRVASPESKRVEIHLRECPRCQTECEQVRQGMAFMEHLPPVDAPEAVWSAIEAAFQTERSSPVRAVPRWRLAIAAGVVAAIAGVAYWRLAHSPGAQWAVVRLDGLPSVGAKPIPGAGRIGAGEWIETDATSRAAIQVGTIGSVEIGPDTRVRVVSASPAEHRLALTHGEIRAQISAPPKLFFVDTASGTAVDLGCEYTLSSDEEGWGMLRVTRGWVSFQWNGLESLVPAGASCRTRPQAGPGIPYFDDAAENLTQALDAFGLEKKNDPLNVILSQSRVRDTLTLWHLLSRVDAGDRGRVFDRMAALVPVPSGVSREKALQLDSETLKRWREELAWTW